MQFNKSELENFILNARKLGKVEISVSSPEFQSPTIGDIVEDFDKSLSTKAVLWSSEELRKLIFKTQRYTSFDIDKNINVTNGNQEANLLSTMISIDPGDEVIVQVPNWPQIPNLVAGFKAKFIPFDLSYEDNWAPDFERLKSLITPKTKLIAISYPNNPTGYVLNKSELKTYCEIAKDAKAKLLNDETYRMIEWEGGPSPSACEFSEDAITTGTVSKTFAAVGVRIGWIISRDETFIQKSKDLHFYTTMQNNNLGEYFVTQMLRKWDEIVPKNLELCKRNLDITSRWMDEHREFLSWVKPRGTTVSFPKINKPMTSTEFAEGLLKQQKTLTVPGITFGDSFDKHIRLSYCKDTNTVLEGLNRLSKYLKTS